MGIISLVVDNKTRVERISTISEVNAHRVRVTAQPRIGFENRHVMPIGE